MSRIFSQIPGYRAHGHKEAGLQTALSAEADALISKAGTLDQKVNGLRATAERTSGAGTQR